MATVPKFNQEEFERTFVYCPNCFWKGVGKDCLVRKIRKDKLIGCPMCKTPVEKSLIGGLPVLLHKENEHGKDSTAE